MELAHGVMVTLRFLVPSFKVRVLVGQQKTPQETEEFFYFQSVFELYFECNYRSYGMVYKIFADASVEEMGKTGSSVGAQSDQIGVDAV